MFRSALVYLPLVFALTTIPVLTNHAQPSQPCPPITGFPLLPCQADTTAREKLRPIPVYPSALQSAGISGLVHIKYVVDTTGRAIPGSLEVVEMTDDVFMLSVRNAIPKWRFFPAKHQGKLVPIQHEEIFQFSLPDKVIINFLANTLTRDTTSEGIPRFLIGSQVKADPSASNFTNAELIDARRNALIALANTLEIDSSVTLCVSVPQTASDKTLDTALLTQLRGPSQKRKIVPVESCPPTYASPIVTVDSLGNRVNPAPPGWVDPYRITIVHLEPWAQNLVFVKADVAQGTGTMHYQCGMRKGEKSWAVECRSGSITVY